MVSNLLVVLCGNRDAQPIVNSWKSVLIDGEMLEAKKQIPLRLSGRNLYDQIAAWAEGVDFRSVNGQIEYLLSECVRRRKKNGKYVSEETGCSPRTGYIRDRIIFLLDLPGVRVIMWMNRNGAVDW